MDKWLHNYFYIFDSHIYNSQESLLFYFYFSECVFCCFFSKRFFYILAFLQLVYLQAYTFSKRKDHIHTLNTMTVKQPCLLCNRAVAKSHKAFCCDRWGHVSYNYLNVNTYRKLQKCKSSWYCMCYLKKEFHSVLLKMNTYKELMHGKIILSPNKKIIMNTKDRTK